MKRAVLLLVVALALVGTIGTGAVCAQETTIVNVPFSFTVANKVMPAGSYEITIQNETVVKVAPQKGQVVMVPTITRLALREEPITTATFIFDRVGEQYYLSELWVPGYGDGYLVSDTKQPHTHQMVKGKKKA